MRIICWVIKAKVTCNTYCFSSAPIVTRTQLIVVLIAHYPLFLSLYSVHSYNITNLSEKHNILKI